MHRNRAGGFDFYNFASTTLPRKLLSLRFFNMFHELNDQSPKNGPEVPATKQEAADATEVTVEDGVVVIKDVSENLDNVSGLRVTTPRFRRHQAEMLREIMNEGGSVIFIQADLDNLKGFNVATGSQTLDLLPI